MKPGDKAKLTKQTFLHQGIFIFTGSTVEIKEIQSDAVHQQKSTDARSKGLHLGQVKHLPQPKGGQAAQVMFCLG